MTGSRSSKILILAMVASLARGLPTTPHVSRSNGYDGLIALCPEALWEGETCQILQWENDLCYVVPENLNNQVKSARAFQGSCVLYRAHNCLGEGTPPIAFPGIDNFDLTSGFYGTFTTWRCHL